MKIVEPQVEVSWVESGADMLRRIEAAGRTAYKSENKVTDRSAAKFVKMLVNHGHLSVIEHVSVTVRIVCDRGVSHEIVRHRLACYTQESTRYCNYAQDRLGGEVAFVRPVFLRDKAADDPLFTRWCAAMEEAERAYFGLLELGAKPEEARSVLPNSLRTELVATMNLRSWRHFFTLRTATAAHPDIQVIANALLERFREHIPVIFDDLEHDPTPAE